MLRDEMLLWGGGYAPHFGLRCSRSARDLTRRDSTVTRLMASNLASRTRLEAVHD